MFRGPGKVVTPNQSDSFGDWQDFHREGEASEFEYSDDTQDHTLSGETQHFKYGRTPLPDKG